MVSTSPSALGTPAPVGRAPIKVLLVCHSSGPGGVEKRFGEVLRRLAGSPGFEVAAAYPDGRFAAEWEALAPRIPYAGSLPVSLRPKGYLGWFVRGITASRALRDYIEIQRPDVVVTFTSVLTRPVTMAWRRGVPVVSWVRERIRPAWVRRSLWRFLARRSSEVVTISRQLVDEFAKVSGHEPVMIHEGIDLPPLREGVEGSDRPVVAFYGGYDPNKGGDVYVRAIGALAAAGVDAEFRYHGVVKSSSKERRFRDLVVSLAGGLGVLDRVRFIPIVGFDDTYAEADVVVVASYDETLGLVALEAMANAVPVVVSEVGGLVGPIRAAEAGELFEPGDAAGLASAIRMLLADPALRRAMGARGRELVEREFSAEDSLRRTEALLQRVVRGIR